MKTYMYIYTPEVAHYNYKHKKHDQRMVTFLVILDLILIRQAFYHSIGLTIPRTTTILCNSFIIMDSMMHSNLRHRV